MSENRPGSGGTEDNVRDELDDATSHGKGKDATKRAVEEEEQTGGNPSGGTKDAVKDDFDEAQRRSH